MNLAHSIIFALSVAMPSGSREGLTSRDIQTLPVAVLAERLLGLSGHLILDIQRPQSLPGTVKLFGKAAVPGSQFGICSSELLKLQLNEKGSVSSIEGQTRYGVVGSIYTNPKSWTYQQFGELCEQVKNTSLYFPSPDGQTALTIVAYLDAIAGRGPSEQDGFDFECSGYCRDDSLEILNNIALESIVEVVVLDCDEISVYHTCIKLVLNGEPAAEFPKVIRIYGKIRMPDQVDIEKVKIWLGTTWH